MDYKTIQKNLNEKADKTIKLYEDELSNIRAGRANPSLLDRVAVNAYGQDTPVNQLASISAPEPRLITVQPWDANLITDIEKAILKSDLGLNPSNDGKIIRLVIPELTEERRKELIKIVKKDEENTKVAIRNLRRDAIDEVKKLEKEKLISEDERKSHEEDIQDQINSKIKTIEDITKRKEEELLEI